MSQLTQPLVHSPGPWRFVLNPRHKQLYMASESRGQPLVFDCVRWGMQSATIRFNTNQHIMMPAHELGEVIPGREHHQAWARQLTHPDALLIQAAPDLLAALVHARNVIKDWHNMNNNGDDEIWEIYARHAPEMQLINQAILLATPQLPE